MKSDQTIIRKNHMEQLHFITKLLDIKDLNIQIMNQFHRKSHEYKAIKRYWKLIQQDSQKLSDKRFYHQT